MPSRADDSSPGGDPEMADPGPGDSRSGDTFEGDAIGGEPDGDGCIPHWHDVSVCDCSPTACAPCNGQVAQEDGCGHDRNQPCTVPASGCAGPCCLGQCCDAQTACAPNGDCRELLTQAPVRGLERLANPRQLPYVDPAGTTTFQASSFDTTGGNDDGFAGLYCDGSPCQEVDGRYLLLDTVGPGCVYRLWMAQPLVNDQLNPGVNPDPLALEAHLQFRFNDETSSRIDRTVAELFSGAHAPFVFPLVASGEISSGGLYSYVPICFASRLRVYLTRPPHFYQLTVKKYPPGTSLTEFSWGPDPTAARDAMLQPEQLFEQDVAAETSVSLTVGGQSETQADLRQDLGTIGAVLVRSPTSNFDGLNLRIYWDHETTPSVDIPLGLLLGQAKGRFVPADPPFSSIDTHTFTQDATGYFVKELVVQGQQVFVRDPLEETWARDRLGARWWKVGLDFFWSGTSSNGHPLPTSNLDSYTWTPWGGEILIAGDRYWSRVNLDTAWYSDTLAAAWPGQSSNGFDLPHDNIDHHSVVEFVTRDDTSTETVISGDRYWSRSLDSAGTPAGSWWSDTLAAAWPGQSSNGFDLPDQDIDGRSVAPDFEETVYEGDRGWSRALDSAGTPTGSWWSDTLDSWWHAAPPLTQGLFVGAAADGYFYLAYPMPFWQQARVTVYNTTTTSKSIDVRVVYLDFGYDSARAGHFVASPHSQIKPAGQLIPNDYALLSQTGAGTVVGVVLGAAGDTETWGRTFLEADERFFVDQVDTSNPLTADLHGTGTEDFFNGGWYFLYGPFTLPFHGAPVTPPNRRFDAQVHQYDSTTETVMYRFLVGDSIPFQQRIDLNWEWGPTNQQRQSVRTDLRSVVFWYRYGDSS